MNLKLLLLTAAFVFPSFAPHNALDQEPTKNGFPVLIEISRPTLTYQQRLTANVEIQVDGKHLQTRRQGELTISVEITDDAGQHFHNQGHLDLTKLDENIKAAMLQYSFAAFFLPGDYHLAVTIVDSATQERTVNRGHFRIAAPREISTEDWRALPSVEFIGAAESPDSWYLPDVEGKLQWAAAVHVPTHLNIILNVAPSVTAPGSRSTPSGGLPALLPTLKVILRTASATLSEDLELLDIARHRAVFKQEDLHSLDWPRLKTSLSETNTASIDVGSLADSHHDAQFFVSEVRKMLRSSSAPCGLVVLSAPIAFAPGEDLEAISTEALPNCRVFYIRYRSAPPREPMADRPMRMGGRGRMGGGPSGHIRVPEAPDKLAATLKPLNAKVFDVESPTEMNHALAEIAKGLAKP